MPEEFRYRPEDLEKKGEGEFTVSRIENPNDPRMKDVQRLLEGEFSKDEVDPLSVTKEAMKDKDEPYMVFMTEDDKKEVVGVNLTASLRIRDEEGEPMGNERILYTVYTVIPEQYRSGGHAGVLVRDSIVHGVGHAEQMGDQATWRVGEASPKENEAFHNKAMKANEGMRRLYYQDGSGKWVEAPYTQVPLEWDEKTGAPVSEGVSEHLMVGSLQEDTNTIDGNRLTDIVRTLHYYNMQYEDTFADEKAYGRHEEEIEKYVEDFRAVAAGKTFQLMDKNEREQRIAQGEIFVENKASVVQQAR